jgi:glutamate-1-semialdehyde 2,1-aminomutase
VTDTQESGWRDRVEAIIATELEALHERTRASAAARERASEVMPMGVPANGQLFGPSPLFARRAVGSHLEDLDGHDYIDFNMGYGALFVGHGHPAVMDAVRRQTNEGTLFVLACEANADVASSLRDRFGQPLWRFTNSGTETTMAAVRTARAFTGRQRIVKVEGGYHGQYDWIMASFQPPIEQAGPPDAPTTVGMSPGVPESYLALTTVVQFNDLEGLARALEPGDVACFIVEPVIQNTSMLLPNPGYLAGVRELCDRTGTVLVFDEVKSGITAGWGGASTALGVQADIVCVSKSIGGGLPLGAFGGRRDIMDRLRPGGATQVGTFSGNPLAMAAARATLDEACTPQATDTAIARCTALVEGCAKVIAEHDLPAHTVQCGAKGCVTWAPQPLRSYRDYLGVDRRAAMAQWLWGINRGILMPAAMDSQWLVSLQHSDGDIDTTLAVFRSFADALTGSSG